MNIGFFSALWLLIIGLKLGGAIYWSWWLILSPLWFVPVLVIFMALLAVTLEQIK